MSSKCKACLDPISDDEGIRCSSCKSEFHTPCSGLSENALLKLSKGKKENWKCVACLKKLDDVKPKTRSGSTVESTSDLTTIINQNTELKDLITKKLKDHTNQYMELKDLISKNFIDLNNSIEFNSSVIEGLKKTIIRLESTNKDLQEKCIQLAAENTVIKKELNEIKLDVIELKQYSRRTNIEIAGIPESENEDMSKILSKIDEISDTNIVDNLIIAHRVPSFKKDKPKPIIVQMKSKQTRDEILKKLKNRRLTTSEINNRFEDMPIYVNEHLTHELKSLFYHARNFKKENNYKFCWTRDGKIFIRKDETSRILRIKLIEDLNQLSTT